MTIDANELRAQLLATTSIWETFGILGNATGSEVATHLEKLLCKELHAGDVRRAEEAMKPESVKYAEFCERVRA